jgi:hypothetical protein
MSTFDRYLALCIAVGIGLVYLLPEVFAAVGAIEMATINLPVAPLPGEASVATADLGRQHVAVLADRLQEIGYREADVALLQEPHVGNEVHGYHFQREGAVASDHLGLGFTGRHALGDLQSGMVARIVIDQDTGARLHIAGNDAPRRGDELVAGLGNLGTGQAASRDDRHVGVVGQNGVFASESVGGDLHPELLALCHSPVADADHLAPEGVWGP